MKKLKNASDLDDKLYTEFDLENSSFFTNLKKKAVRIINNFKRGRKLSSIKKKRKSQSKK
jgi:hypothetical protein